MSASTSHRREARAPRNRIAVLVIIPIIPVAVLLGFIAIRAVTPPIVRYFDENTTASVALAAEIALELTEDGMDTLLSMRLSQDRSMIQTMRADTVQQLEAMIEGFPTVELAIVELPDTLLMSSCDCGVPVEYFAEHRVQRESDAVQLNFDGPVLAHWEYFPFYRWVIVTFAPERISHAPLNMVRRSIAVSTIGTALGLIVTVVLVFQGLVTRRLRTLVRAAHELAAGAYPVVGDRRADEIAQVGGAFDRMVQSVREKESAADSAYRQLATSESRFRRIVENTTAGYFYFDARSVLRAANQALADILGYNDPSDLHGLHFDQVRAQGEDQTLAQEIARLKDGQSVESAEFRALTRDGEVRYTRFSASPVLDSDRNVGVEGFLIDVTTQKRAEERVRQSLHEKEALLREVHHRVRNNLNVIVSLMHLQSRKFSDDDPVAEGLLDIESRIMSMSLVHSMIYESQSLAAIDMKEYLTRLTEEIVSMSTVDTEVHLELELESVEVELDVGIPVGLLANEMITNSIKHAFPGRREGTIRVSYRRSQGRDTLAVEDNGVGIPDHVASTAAPRDSLGITLMHQLASQLDAELTISGDNGTRVSVHFAPHR